MKKEARAFIVLLGIAGVTFCLVRFYKHDSVKPPVTDEAKIQRGYEWNDIELPDNYSWREETLTDDDFFSMRAFYDGRYAESELPGQSGDIVFPSGKYYSTVITDMEVNSFPGQNLWGKIDKSMNRNGWKMGIPYAEYEIQGTAADGPTGSLVGYVKKLDNQLRTIVYSYSVSGTWVGTSESPAQLKCPCKTTINIFISDPVDLSEVLPK